MKAQRSRRVVDGWAALWLKRVMRNLTAVAVLAGALVSGCTSEPPPEALSCTARFDCAADEICDDGICVLQDTQPVRREDAGPHYSRPDANTVDSGQVDSGQPDSGEVADAGVADSGISDTGIEDAGAFDAGCPTPIAVDGFRGYCTIGAAVAAATMGALIEVPSGVYAEAVDISKALTLQGSSGATIQGPAGVAPLRIRSAGVHIDTFAIQAQGTIGVEVVGSSTLNGLVINGAAGIGIAVSLSGTVVEITNTTINAVAPADPIWGEGIELNAGVVATVINTTINDAAYLGILNLGATLTLNSSRIERAGRARCGSDEEYCGYGLVTDNGTTTVENGTVINASSAAGVIVFQADFDISGSSVTNSGQRGNVWSPGVLIDGGGDVHINNNDISGNQNEGVGCWNPPFDDADSCENNTHVNNGVWTNCGSC